MLKSSKAGSPVHRIKPFFLFLFLASCGTEKFIEPEYLNTPLNLAAYSKNSKIRLKFFLSNKEETFDGLNIYLSRTSSVKAQANLLPVKNPSTGSLPSMSLTSSQVTLGQPWEIEIDRDENDEPIENGIKYYIILKSHSFRNFKSEPSNESSATPRPESASPVILQDNEGFSFNSFSKQAPYHLLFRIIDLKMFFFGQNGAQLQSKGYYENWADIREADETGYALENTPFPAEPGHVYLIRTSENKYGKFQVLSADSLSVLINWAFQNMPNNKDI